MSDTPFRARQAGSLKLKGDPVNTGRAAPKAASDTATKKKAKKKKTTG